MKTYWHKNPGKWLKVGEGSPVETVVETMAKQAGLKPDMNIEM